jgi:hypothetical protein
MKLTNKFAQIALVLAALPVAAVAGDMGTIYTQIGSNGLGLGYAKSVSQDWAVRGQYNALPKTSFSGDVGDFGSGNTLEFGAVAGRLVPQRRRLSRVGRRGV